jgi:hypothetical protein
MSHRSWWPTAEWENLLTGAHFVAWLFIWDDTIDEGEGELSSSFELGEQYRRETIAYIALGLAVEESSGSEASQSDDNDAVLKKVKEKQLTGKPKAASELFNRFAERVRQVYDYRELLNPEDRWETLLIDVGAQRTCSGSSASLGDSYMLVAKNIASV